MTGGTRGALSGSGMEWTLAVTAGSAGTLTVAIAADAVSPGNAAASEDFTVNALPTVTISASVDPVENGDDTTITFQWSEDVSGFATGDVTISTGTKGTFTAVDADTYTLVVTAPSSGTGEIDITVAANAVTLGNAETELTIDYVEPFTLSWEEIPTDTVNNQFTVELHISHPVTGLDIADITLRRISGTDSNSNFNDPSADELTITQIEGTNNYSLAFDLDGDWDGTYLIRLRPNRLTYSGNTYPSSSLNTSSFTIDSDHSTDITATISTTDTDIRAGETVDIDIDFSASVTGFTASDITVSGGTGGALSGSGTDYTLSVTAGSAGTLTVSIAADVVTEGNVAASQDFTINALPTVTLSASTDPVENGEDTTITFQWSESVSGFVTGDVTLSTGTKGTFTAVDADTYTLVVTAPSSGTGEIDITVAANAVTLGNAETELTIDYQPAAVTPTLGWIVPTETVGNTFSATLTSNVALDAAPAVGDLRLRDDDNSDPVITLNNANTTITAIAGTNNYLIELELTGTYDDDYTIRINGNTVQYNGVNVLTAQLASAVFSIDSSVGTGITATITTDDTDIRAGESIDIDFEFSASVTGFTAPDITVSGGTKGTLTGSGTDYTLSVTAGSAGDTDGLDRCQCCNGRQ